MEKSPSIDQIVEAIDSEPLKKHGLKIVGSGGEKVCFETEGNDERVIKVSRWVLRRKIRELLGGEEEKPIFVDSSEKAQAMEYKGQEEALIEIFGEDHVLKKRIFRLSVPVTREIALALSFDENLTSKIDGTHVSEVKMFAEVQPIAHELRDREKYKTQSLHTPLIKGDVYSKFKDLTEKKEAIESVLKDRIDEQYFEWAANGYVETVRKVVEGVIQYTKSTGLMVDLVSRDNLTVFTREDGQPDFHLVDPVLPNTREHWSKNIQDDPSLDLFRHWYTYYFAINYLIQKLDIDMTLYPEDLNYFKGTGIPTE